MICRKLLLLALFLAELSQQSEEIAFRRMSDDAGSIADRFLQGGGDEDDSSPGDNALEKVKKHVSDYFEEFLREHDNYNVSRGIQLRRVDTQTGNRKNREDAFAGAVEELLAYADTHVIEVQINEVYEDFSERLKRSTGKLDHSERSFALKSLMMPVMIGVQIFKSVLFAMFLPSVLGNLGRVVGEGVKYLSSNRYQSPTGMGSMEDFEFKDMNNYEQQYPEAQADGSSQVYSYAYANPFDYNKQVGVGVYPAASQSSVANRFTTGAHKLNYVPNNNHHGSFYTKHSDKHGKRQDFKVFHNIPSSSLLLTNYDPFYSPLLSRMDSVFKQLGYESETCRERLICLMYKNPAKFAPYSNLISAQLSRELNELRKPSTDNPDILRFFKYMKAAKDGQDGEECAKAYTGCTDSRESISSPMVKTFNEINKLVHARKLST